MYQANENRYNLMDFKKSGESGLKLPIVSLGFWHNFGDISNFDNMKKMCFTAFDNGITHFDLANNYGPEPGSAEKNTGRMHAQSTAFGGYYTKITNDSAYFDIVGIVGLLNNGFKDSYGEKSAQDGWRTGVSLETGYPFVSNSGWGLEPQLQLAYQHTHYSSFSDSYSDIEGYNADMLRGRGGFRVFKDIGNNGSQLYGVANIIHDFTDFKIDGTSIGEEYDKSYGEAGVGFNLKTTEKSSIYGDMRYQKSFGGNMDNATFSIGFKKEF